MWDLNVTPQVNWLFLDELAAGLHLRLGHLNILRCHAEVADLHRITVKETDLIQLHSICQYDVANCFLQC